MPYQKIDKTKIHVNILGLSGLNKNFVEAHIGHNKNNYKALKSLISIDSPLQI